MLVLSDYSYAYVESIPSEDRILLCYACVVVVLLKTNRKDSYYRDEKPNRPIPHVHTKHPSHPCGIALSLTCGSRVSMVSKPLPV